MGTRLHSAHDFRTPKLILFLQMLHEPAARQPLRVSPALDGARRGALVLVNSLAVRILEGDADSVVVNLLFREDVLLRHKLTSFENIFE